PFRTIAKRQYHQAPAARPDKSRLLVQGDIIRSATCMIAYPAVQYACSIDAKQDADAFLRLRIVDMGEAIDSRGRVIYQLVAHSIDNPRGPRRSGYLSGLQHI